jgi:hypothetical protein
MNTKIYINSELIDITDDVSIPLTYAIADVREPEKRNTTFSKTVVIPGSQLNNKLFGQIWNVNSSVNSSGTTNFNPMFNPNLKATAIITYKDVVQFTGIVQLLNVNLLDEYEINYEVAFLGELGNIFQAIENKTLAQVDLSAYNHLYTAQNQKNSWNNSITKNGASYPFTLGEGYVYPLIDYGYNNGVDWNVKHLFPAVYVKTIIDKIIGDAGFQYSSNFFNTDLFKRLVIPFSGGSTLKLTDTQIENRTFRATSSGTTTINLYGSSALTNLTIGDESTAPNYDTGNVYNNTTSKFTVAKSGTYTIRLKPKVSITHFPSANTTLSGTSARIGWFRIVKDNGGNGTQLMSIEAKINSSSQYQYPNDFNLNNNSLSVTSGTTTLESTGELSCTVTATAGDIIYCNFYYANGDNIYSNAPASASNYARLNINVGTLFATQLTDVNIQEGDSIELNNVLPSKFKQSEFLKSIIKCFNLFIQQDKLIPNKLLIEPRKNFYPNTADYVRDWTDKLDDSRQIKIVPMGELNTKRFIFTYKKDEDYYNKQYFDEYQEVYGEKILDVENDFLKGEIKNEVIFSPTPLVDTIGIDRIIPKIYDVDEQGTIKPKASNIRLLYYGGVKTTNNPYNHIATSGTTVLSTYGYAGHVDNPTSPVIDLSFGVPKEVMYLTESYTANNLYNVYWADYFNELIDKNSKIFIGYFKLDEIDINELNFQCSFYFENEYWRLNKIYDYNPSSGEPTKCEFVKLKTSIPFAEDAGVPIKGGVTPLNNNDTAPAATNRTLSNNSYGIKSFGQYNNLPSIGDGILVTGNYNSVGEGASNVTILGSSGVTILGGLSNVTLINSNDVEVTESNTSYVNGVAVSTSVAKVYEILATQTGGGTPSVITLQNTLSGTPSVTATATGEYSITLTGEFIEDKVSAIICLGKTGGDNLASIQRQNDNTIVIKTRNLAGTLTDDILTQSVILIKVYP